MNIKILQRAIAGGFLVLLIAFVFVLVSSLGERKNTLPANPFAALAIGETSKRWYQGQWAWGTRLSELQRRSLAVDSRCRDEVICIVPATGITPSIDLVYTQKKPPQLGVNNEWSGGLVDPSNGTVYRLDGQPFEPLKAQSQIKD